MDPAATRHGARRHAGFTLIELMIVIAIIAIIAAIAYPNYMNSVRKANRADAKSMLSQVASRQEQYFLNNKSYTASISNVWGASSDSPEGYYTLSITDLDGTADAAKLRQGYILTATAKTTGPQNDDTGCTVFTLDSRGNRTVEDCW